MESPTHIHNLGSEGTEFGKLSRELNASLEKYDGGAAEVVVFQSQRYRALSQTHSR